ncbi:MAG: hypothetical protein ABSD67_16265 [Terracidiphilus sp.]|jgi:hypothetical protein
MKPFGLVSLAILFGAASLTAQTTASYGVAGMEGLANQPQTQTVVIQLPQSNNACPVSVQARQAASWNRMEVSNDRPKGPAQRLHLTLVNPKSKQITSATVAVHGLTPKTRATLTTMVAGNSPSDAARTLDISFSAGSAKEVSADLWVPGLSAAYSIDLIGITYADGSTWKLADGFTCRTSIDALMLIRGQ